MNRPAVCLLCAGAALAACAGPRWSLAPPDDAAVYVDGRRETRTRMPRRYYGTTAVDAVPLPQPDQPLQEQLVLVPARRLTTHAEPVTPWLFPFDFPLECLVRLFTGAPDLPLDASLQPNQRTVPGFPPADLGELRARAQAARISR